MRLIQLYLSAPTCKVAGSSKSMLARWLGDKTNAFCGENFGLMRGGEALLMKRLKRKIFKVYISGGRPLARYRQNKLVTQIAFGELHDPMKQAGDLSFSL